MTKTTKLKAARLVFAGFTILMLVVTFYFPLIGLGYALDRSASLESRGEGLLFVLPSLAMLLFLIGVLPSLRVRALWWLGLVATLVALPSSVACARSGFPAAIGTLASVAYVGGWWLLVKSKLARLSKTT